MSYHPVVRPGSELLNKPKIVRIFQHINDVKRLSHKAAYEFKRNPLVAVKYAMRVYGTVTTYTYEETNIDYDNSSIRLLLAGLIAERILLRQEKNLWKHVTISIIGLGGSGKTTYAVTSAYGALRLVGYSRNEAIKMVSELTFFNPKEFVEFVENIIKEGTWVPFIILDDIGSQISKYWIFLGQKHWAYLFSVLDQLKDWCGALIMTARSDRSIPARLREITDLFVDAEEVSIGEYVLDLFLYFYGTDYTPSKARRRKKAVYLDALLPVIKMPEELWKKMIESRRLTGKERIEYVKKMIEIKPLEEKKKLLKLEEELKKIKEEEEEGEEVE